MPNQRCLWDARLRSRKLARDDVLRAVMVTHEIEVIDEERTGRKQLVVALHKKKRKANPN